MSFEFKVGIGNQELDVHVIREDWKSKWGLEIGVGKLNWILEVGIGNYKLEWGNRNGKFNWKLELETEIKWKLVLEIWKIGTRNWN